MNYVRDLRVYSPTNRHIRANLQQMVQAFFEITGTAQAELEEKVKRMYGEGLYKGEIESLPLKPPRQRQKQPSSFVYELKVVRARRRYGHVQKLRASDDVYRAFQQRYEQADREEFLAVLVDNKNSMLGYNVVSVGSLTSALVHPREVYKPAILANAASVILVHNHPSGDPAPSPEDMEITKRLKETGEVLGIKVLDHIVIGDGRYFSFSDRGLL